MKRRIYAVITLLTMLLSIFGAMPPVYADEGAPIRYEAEDYVNDKTWGIVTDERASGGKSASNMWQKDACTVDFVVTSETEQQYTMTVRYGGAWGPKAQIMLNGSPMDLGTFTNWASSGGVDNGKPTNGWTFQNFTIVLQAGENHIVFANPGVDGINENLMLDYIELAPYIPPPPAPETQTPGLAKDETNLKNVALGKGAMAIASKGGDEVPARLTDGKRDRAWVCEEQQAAGHKWAIIDLGKPYEVLRWKLWSDNPLYEFQIQALTAGTIYDGTWTMADAMKGNTSKELDRWMPDSLTVEGEPAEKPGAARYWRLYITDAQNDPQWDTAKVFEWELYAYETETTVVPEPENIRSIDTSAPVLPAELDAPKWAESVNLLADGEFSLADGSYTKTFDQNTLIARWAVDNSADNIAQQYVLEYDTGDGNWRRADAVVSNTASRTDRRIDAISAKQVRLTVEAGDEDGIKAIADLELYGPDVLAEGEGGLFAEYYDNTDLSGTRVTGSVDTLDGAVTAPAGINAEDGFSARFSGKIQPAYTENYTFSLTANEGVRLWVNDHLLIDAWDNASSAPRKADIALHAGRRYNISIEMRKVIKDASLMLQWESASEAAAIVPQQRLWPEILSASKEFARKSTQDYIQYPDPFVGTSPPSDWQAPGATFPGATAPNGMISLSPHTAFTNYTASSGYDGRYNSFYGYGVNHQSGVCMSDSCMLPIMPTVGEVQTDKNLFSSPIENEFASPGYYTNYLTRYGVTSEVTATTRSGMMRFTFPESDGEANVLFDINGENYPQDGYVNILSPTEIEGFAGQGWRAERSYGVFFVAEFDTPAVQTGTWRGNELSASNYVKSADPDFSRAGAYFQFDTENGQEINMKIGISYVSIENARQNLHAEIPHFDFDEVRRRTENTWNDTLSKIETVGTSTNQQLFYTSLYHIMMHPSVFSDVNGDYRRYTPLGYGQISPIDADLTEPFIMNTEGQYTHYYLYSLWDSYRGVHTLVNTLYPEKGRDMMQTLVKFYKDGGRYYPKWELYGRDLLLQDGSFAPLVLADAYVKGLTGFDTQSALEGSVINALERSYVATDVVEGQVKNYTISNYARGGADAMDSYEQNGYVGQDTNHMYTWGSVSLSLENYYTDFGISQLAKSLGDTENAEKFADFADNYTNLHREVGEVDGHKQYFFMARNEDGSWAENQNDWASPGAGGVYCEGDRWAYAWHVPHAIPELIELNGGKDNFFAQLNDGFSNNRIDIGNEPGFDFAYLFTYADDVETRNKTAFYVRKLMSKMFNMSRGGLPGNDDAGAMSAWWNYGAMGFYPHTKATQEYRIGSPMFKEMTMHLNPDYYAGETFTVLADGANKDNIYIKDMKLNDVDKNDFALNHNDIVNGGILEVTMVDASGEVTEIPEPREQLETEDVTRLDKARMDIEGYPDGYKLIFGSAGRSEDSGYETVFDGDMSTAFDGYENGFVGIYGGIKCSISQIEYCQREWAGDRMVGAKLQGTNDPNTLDDPNGVLWEDIYTFTEESGYHTMKKVTLPEDTKPYTYFRILSKPNDSINIAELVLYYGRPQPMTIPEEEENTPLTIIRPQSQNAGGEPLIFSNISWEPVSKLFDLNIDSDDTKYDPNTPIVQAGFYAGLKCKLTYVQLKPSQWGGQRAKNIKIQGTNDQKAFLDGNDPTIEWEDIITISSDEWNNDHLYTFPVTTDKAYAFYRVYHDANDPAGNGQNLMCRTIVFWYGQDEPPAAPTEEDIREIYQQENPPMEG